MCKKILSILSAAALVAIATPGRTTAQSGDPANTTAPARPICQYMAVAWESSGYLVTENWGQSWRIVSEESLSELPERLVALVKANRAGRQEVQAAVIPNPTSGSTTLRFTADRAGSVRIMVHDVRGSEVISVPLEVDAGYQTQKIDLSSLPNGAYYYRILDERGSIGSGSVTVSR